MAPDVNTVVPTAPAKGALAVAKGVLVAAGMIGIAITSLRIEHAHAVIKSPPRISDNARCNDTGTVERLRSRVSSYIGLTDFDAPSWAFTDLHPLPSTENVAIPLIACVGTYTDPGSKATIDFTVNRKTDEVQVVGFAMVPP